jgi:hypothetical protein
MFPLLNAVLNSFIDELEMVHKDDRYAECRAAFRTRTYGGKVLCYLRPAPFLLPL